MNNASPPAVCIVCNSLGSVVSAHFIQLYRQGARDPIAVPWWECRTCRSWFGSPRPTPEQIERNWQVTAYNNPEQEALIALLKERSQALLLETVERWAERKGTLLDYGCNFGHFLDMARERGWQAIGADASAAAVEACRKRGFSVSQGWALEGLAIPPRSLRAIVSSDVFCYVWHPYRHLARAFELLEPEGVLMMRTSNKRAVQGILRLLTIPGSRRDRRMSQLLQDQFHSIDARALSRVLTSIGFRVLETRSGATTAPAERYSVPSRFLYRATAMLDWLSLGRLNFSPGVYVVAKKV